MVRSIWPVSCWTHPRAANCSGAGSPGLSRRKGCKTVCCWTAIQHQTILACTQKLIVLHWHIALMLLAWSAYLSHRVNTHISIQWIQVIIGLLLKTTRSKGVSDASKSIFSLVWPWPLTSWPQSWSFHGTRLGTWITCVNWRRNWFILLQNIMFTSLVADEQTNITGWEHNASARLVESK